MRPTVKSTITQDLKYCCTWYFFKLYRRSSLVAERLGFTTRAVQKAKADANAGQCAGCENCLLKKLTVSADPRKMPYVKRTTDTTSASQGRKPDPDAETPPR